MSIFERFFNQARTLRSSERVLEANLPVILSRIPSALMERSYLEWLRTPVEDVSFGQIQL